VAFRILIVVRRLEGADRLAHEWKVAGQGSNGEDERLSRIVPRPVDMGVFGEQERRKSAAACRGVSSIDEYHIAAAGSEVNHEYPEVLPDHDAPPCCAGSAAATSAISRQSWGQKGTHRPQWMQTKGSPVGSR